MDLSASMPRATESIVDENYEDEQEDGLFDRFIDSESFDSSDNGAVDRTKGDDWSILFDFAPPYNQILCPDSPTSAFCDERFPIAEMNKILPAPNDADRIVSLVDLDAIKYPTPPHSTSSLSSRKSGRAHDRTTPSTSKAKSNAVNRSSKNIPAPLKMSHPSGSRRASTDKRGSTSGSSTASGRGQTRPGRPPLSTAMSQPQWSSVPPHSSYEQPSTGGPPGGDVPAFRDPYTSHSPLHLSRTTSAQLSPVASPGYGEYGHEEGSHYFQSPSTPYATEAEAPLESDYPAFSHYPSETSFPFESAHESGMGIPYTRSAEYAESQVRPWWPSASGTQPYTTTYPTAGYGQVPHRHTDAPQSNYSNIGYEQQHHQPYLERRDSSSANVVAPASDRGRGRPQATLKPSHQFTEPILRSSSPSSTPQGVRKGSSSASAQSRTGGTASSSKPPRRKSGGQGGSRRDAQAGIGFVNFTPEDSKKILTGVAPSGSSKTKARRDKEAADRRKRISKATAKAVRDAGGDLEALKREGFILEEEETEEEEGSHSGG